MAVDDPLNTERTNGILVQILFRDIDLAFTFLQAARISPSSEIKQQAEEHALKTYQSILQVSGETKISEEIRVILNNRLEHLRSRLRSIGFDA